MEHSPVENREGMDKVYRLKFIIFLLLLIANAPCVDCADYEFPTEYGFDSSYTFPYTRDSILSTYPQKITKTVQGIVFDSDYDNGSLLDVQEAGTNVFNCIIYAEPGELGTRRYWFRFKMTGVAGRTITINIDHSENPRPVISLDGENWRRLTTSEAPSSYRIVLTFPADENSAELAFFFPSGYEETYRRVSALIRRTDDATTDIIGQSFQERDMWMVTVTDSYTTDTGKHRVWLHSRAHAGEVTSTLLMLGFLDQITTDSYEGRRLRHFCIFNIVPLQNIDGVFLGHTRWDSQGIDPERQWGNPDRIPEVGNIKTKVDEFMASPNPIEVALNLHSTKGNNTDTFFFKHIYPSVTHNFEQIEQRFIDAFDHATPLFDNLSPHFSQLDPIVFIESYFWNNWGEAVMALTHEGHYFRRITDNQFITDENYYELGRAMARALIEYFNLPELPAAAGFLFY